MDCMRYKITIHDRPNEKNYYRLIIEENTYRISSETGIKYGPFSSYPEIINQEDIVLTDGHLTTADDDKFGILDWTIRNLSNVFTDGRFENGSYTLKIYTSVPHISESNGKIILLGCYSPLIEHITTLLSLFACDELSEFGRL